MMDITFRFAVRTGNALPSSPLFIGNISVLFSKDLPQSCCISFAVETQINVLFLSLFSLFPSK